VVELFIDLFTIACAGPWRDLFNASLGLSKKNHGDHGDHGEKRGKGFMEEKFSMSYNQAHPRDPRVPRGLASSEFNSRLGFT